MYQLVPPWGPALLPASRYPTYHMRYLGTEGEKANLAIKDLWVNGFLAESKSKRNQIMGNPCPSISDLG